MNTQTKLLLKLALLVLVWWHSAVAQDTTCNAGDIAWVSSAVNANVGLASGSGRCAANTVAGGNYNDPNVPFGIQGAMDCACANSFIHVLGDGDYGSSTASWNNRFDASKEIRSTVTVNPRVTIIGYADSSTSCRDSNSAAGCPVDMDFAGGSADGWDLTSAVYNMFGIGIHNATEYGIRNFNTNSDSLYAGVELTGNGWYGIVLFATSGSTSITRSTITGNGGGTSGSGFGNGGILTADSTYVLYNYIANNTGNGIRANNGNSRTVNMYNVIQGNDIGILLNGIEGYFQNNTIRDSVGDGITSLNSTTSVLNQFVANLIADNGGYGINEPAGNSRTAGFLLYNVFSNNASGDLQSGLGAFGIAHGNVFGASVSFVSSTDSNVVGSDATITTSYPSGNTPLVFNAGAIPDAIDGSGGGGVYIPVGPR